MNETEVRTRHFSRLEYERLLDGGTLGPEERFELIGGHLIPRAPQRDTHGTSADLAAAALQKAFGFGYRVRVQLPLALDDDSEPEPDVSVVRGSLAQADRTLPSRPDVALEEKRARADLATDSRFYETKPIIVADTP